MQLYIYPASNNVRKTRAVAKHLGLELEEIEVDLFAGGSHTPEYLALNPNGKVPLLVDGDLKLWESNAICCYLASKGAEGNSLWPRTSARYEILRWLFWESAHFNRCISTIAFERLLKPRMGAEPDEAIIEATLPNYHRFMQVLEDHLEGRTWIVGETVTLADIVIGASAVLIGPSELPAEQFPNVMGLVASLDEIPAWRETSPF